MHYLEMSSTPVSDKPEKLPGADSSRTLNESYASSDYSVEEDQVQSQEESIVATAKPGDLYKSTPGLRQPLVRNIKVAALVSIYLHTEYYLVIRI